MFNTATLIQFQHVHNGYFLRTFCRNKDLMSSDLEANRDGMTKHSSDINSSKLFCSGVPVSRSRRSDLIVYKFAYR